MPTYLCHGFRWKRRSIRVYVVLQDLDDAAPEWVIKKASPRNFIESFYKLFPFLPECTFPTTRSGTRISRSRSTSLSVDRLSIADSVGKDDDSASSRSGRSRTTAARESSNSGRKRTNPDLSRGNIATGSQSPYVQQAGADGDGDPVLSQNWSPVKLLEEHDPANLDEVSRPYAYVADYARRIDASCSIVEEIQRYESRVRRSRAPAVTGPSSDEMLCKRRDGSGKGPGGGWFEQLRDQLQRDEEIRWYVVVNGDEERAWPIGSRPDSSRTSVGQTPQQLIGEGPGMDKETRTGGGTF